MNRNWTIFILPPGACAYHTQYRYLMSRVVFKSSDFFFENSVGNTSVFKYGGPRARSAHSSGIANTNFWKRKVTILGCNTTYVLHWTFY